jgi:hypothetical protein
MLANLKIICQFHADPVHQNSVVIFWAEIYRVRLFLGSNLVSFNRTFVVPYEISKVNFHAEKKDAVRKKKYNKHTGQSSNTPRQQVCLMQCSQLIFFNS